MNSLKTVYLATASLLLFSCMGGGTFGTGIQGYGVSDGAQSAPPYKLIGKLLNEKNEALSGYEITVAPGADPVSSYTDMAGGFTASVVNSGGMPLKFKVSKGNLSFDCETYVSPAGEESVQLNFILSDDSKLICP